MERELAIARITAAEVEDDSNFGEVTFESTLEVLLEGYVPDEIRPLWEANNNATNERLLENYNAIFIEGVDCVY